MNRSLFFFSIVVIAVVALIFRVSFLSDRPMHGDEAVNAVKVSELIEGDEYKYDPYEYHGPTLNYFSLITAWLYGANSFVDLNEEALRILPVLFGLFLLVIIYLLRDALGAQAVLYFVLVSRLLLGYLIGKIVIAAAS